MPYPARARKRMNCWRRLRCYILRDLRRHRDHWWDDQ